MFNFLHKVAIRLIYLSILTFIVGFSIKVANSQLLPLSGADIVIISSSFLAFSVPFGFYSLAFSYRNGVITLRYMAISFIASLFFFVFGYIAVMLMLNASIKEYRNAIT
jgi:hypothetical protein